MRNPSLLKQALEQNLLSPHTNRTRGQSHEGGLVTSYSERRSRFHSAGWPLAYVQGSPKGGGALGSLEVTSTRLWPVPPCKMGVKMHRKPALIFSIFLTAILAGSPLCAQTQSQIEKRLSRDYNECMATGDAAGGVTSAMMDCTGAEIDRQDARLNQAYVMVMRPLPATKKAALRTLQRAWIKQRDARCTRAAKQDEGGTAAAMTYQDCILDETIKRTIFLENYKG